MHKIKEMLMKELKELEKKGELSAGSLDVINKLTDSIKNIDRIEMYEQYAEDDYSEARGRRYSRDSGNSYEGGGNSYRDGSYERGRSRENYNRGSSYGYDDDMSGARRHWVRGHYSRDEAKQDISDQIEEMMSDASPREREVLQRCSDMLEKL